ncbi:TonB family protein [Ancylomarina euxinus]|uniref:TonB family protein n=1 Tax=Ancylomarina euxinus TaxID=2283627 RepID=A0A425XXC7_9BACT|nr:energy transducer TonB [Ancylomarina euxinus]MCZ4696122.1 TonB family protein [Ancylomarina euxinus]MUP16531.1 TonB family protein [Ancylomarina euxinus]RRG19322.1 TonB family protein [Ancylomarina euxinus]
MRSFLLAIIFVFLFQFGYSQNDTTIYYKANNKPAIGKEDASHLTKIKKKSENEYKLLYLVKKGDRWIRSKHTRILTVENDSTIKILNQFTRNEYYKTFKPVGDYYYIKEYHKNGKLRIEGLSKSKIFKHWEGQVKEYYPSGKLESITRYKNNQVSGNKNWLENGEPYIDNIFGEVDLMPQFPGGEMKLKKYLGDNLKYPEKAIEKRFYGDVYVSFVIDVDGLVIGANISKSLNSDFDQEALRVVSAMPKWTAGKLDGKPVKVGYTVPIKFRMH